MFQWIYEWPTWSFVLLMIVSMCAVTCTAHFLVRKCVKREVLVSHNDIAGFVVSLVGVIYAVLLSFVVVVVWEQFDSAGQFVQNEASAAANLYHIAYGLPQPTQSTVQNDVREYANLMIADEWPRMRYGTESTRGDQLGHRILRTIIGFAPSNESQNAIRTAAIGDVEQFFDARRDRLDANTRGVPDVMWITLILGAIITISFTLLFGMDNAALQYTFTIGITMLIAVMFAMIIELDLPFRGATSVSPEPWMRLQQELVTLNDYRSAH